MFSTLTPPKQIEEIVKGWGGKRESSMLIRITLLKESLLLDGIITATTRPATKLATDFRRYQRTCQRLISQHICCLQLHRLSKLVRTLVALHHQPTCTVNIGNERATLVSIHYGAKHPLAFRMTARNQHNPRQRQCNNVNTDILIHLDKTMVSMRTNSMTPKSTHDILFG